jgi:hypothetical protein
LATLALGREVVADYNWIFTDTLEETLNKLKARVRGAELGKVDT